MKGCFIKYLSSGEGTSRKIILLENEVKADSFIIRWIKVPHSSDNFCTKI